VLSGVGLDANDSLNNIKIIPNYKTFDFFDIKLELKKVKYLII
jgi:hypothetical protein